MNEYDYRNGVWREDEDVWYASVPVDFSHEREEPEYPTMRGEERIRWMEDNAPRVDWPEEYAPKIEWPKEYPAKIDWPKEYPTKIDWPKEYAVRGDWPTAVDVNLTKDLLTALRELSLQTSKTAVGRALSSGSLIIDIPANAAITKVYVSMLQNPSAPLDNGYLRIYSKAGPLFAYEFFKPSQNAVGTYETAFAQPLLVGSDGAKIALMSYRGLSEAKAEILRIVAVYLPDTAASEQAAAAPKVETTAPVAPVVPTSPATPAALPTDPAKENKP